MVRRRLDDIVLLRDEILQAVRVQGDLLGESVVVTEQPKTAASDDKADKLRKEAKANSLRDMVDDDVKRERVMQVVGLAVEEVGDILYPYTRSVDRHPTFCFSNDYKEPELWRICLDVPVTMSASTTGYIRTLSQEYVVMRVVEEWAKMFLADKLDTVVLTVEDLKTKMRAAKDRRNAPIRRRGSVY